MSTTRTQLQKCLSRLKTDLLEVENLQVKVLTNELFATMCNYSLIEKGITIRNISYIMGLDQASLQLAYLLNYTSLSQFSYSDTTLKSYVTNALNSLFSARSRALGQFSAKMYDHFNAELNSAATVFYLLLSIYLFLVTCQYVLGFLLLRIANGEEELFLRVPMRFSRKLQNLANDFVIYKNVLSL